MVGALARDLVGTWRLLSRIDRDPSIVWDVLRDGNRKARERAQETMQLVREAVQINYSGLQ